MGGDAEPPPRVSVIVATYNSSRTLQWALRSICAQTHADFEVLVVGDGCSDDSAAVVRAIGDPRLAWHNLVQNSGTQAGPNNYGLQRARGELIAYLGHDDLWFPHHLAGLLACLGRHGADFVHPLTATFDRAGLSGVIGTPRSEGGHAWHSPPPSSWLHTRDLASRLGGWRPPQHLPSGVDMDFFHRAHAAGARVHMLDRLSVLKFPSPHFGLYDRRQPHPQVNYWERMQRDARALEHEVLTQAARLLAARLYRDPPLHEMAAWNMRTLLRKLRRFVLSKPMLAPIEARRYQHSRRRLRKRRGLD